MKKFFLIIVVTFFVTTAYSQQTKLYEVDRAGNAHVNIYGKEMYLVAIPPPKFINRRNPQVGTAVLTTPPMYPSWIEDQWGYLILDEVTSGYNPGMSSDGGTAWAVVGSMEISPNGTETIKYTLKEIPVDWEVHPEIGNWVRLYPKGADILPYQWVSQPFKITTADASHFRMRL